MLQAYIVDGSAGESAAMVLAGFVAPAADWAEFSQAWQGVLMQPPSIDYFRMDEAMTLAGQFSGFSENERNTKVALLKDVIDSSGFSGLVCCINLEAFEAALNEFDDVPQLLREPYYYMFFGLVSQIIKHKNYIDIFSSVDWIFNETVLRKEIIGGWEAFRQYAHIPHDRPSAVPSFSDHKTAVPLQAADFLSGLISGSWTECQVGGEPSKFHWDAPADPALPSCKLFVFEWNENALRQHLERAMMSLAGAMDLPGTKVKRLA